MTASRYSFRYSDLFAQIEIVRNSLVLMVGAEGFEPPTLCSQSRCATRLRYAPTVEIVS
jgi:hypothetical protein